MNPRTPLRAGRIRELLPAHRFTRDLRVMGVVSSTSDLLLEQARKGVGDGTVIVAEQQTMGRGRRGTAWECPGGQGVLFSALIRPLPPAPHRPLLSAALGLGVCRALRGLGLPALVKWPNDVLVERAKVAGTLIDLTKDFAVLGIGINVNQGRGELPEHAPQPAGSLALLLGRTVEREAVLTAVLEEIGTVLEDLEADSTDALISQYLKLDALAGRRVAARAGDAIVEGLVIEAHPRDGLLIRPDAGEDTRLRPEHCHLLRVDAHR